MTDKLMTIRVADLYCGAGGSSEGVRRALEKLGVRMKLKAVNHWPTAIKTHSRNHPDAEHFCVDLDHVRPQEIVPEGKLDLLLASPTCTYYSKARGGQPTSDQQRMSPWNVVNWLTEIRVKVVVIENVPEFRDWGPIDPKTGKPLKSRRGEYFKAWVRAIEALGFTVEFRILNAADYGDATTRERFFLIGRSDKQPIQWPDPSHNKDGSNGLSRWRAAREVIDWQLQGQSIFTRARRLSDKTLARILAGARKFGWPAAIVELLERYVAGEDYATICRDLEARELVLEASGQPFMSRTDMHLSNACCVRSQDSPLPTITTSNGLGLAQPLILPQGSSSPARRADETPVPTIVAVARPGLAQPFVTQRLGVQGPRSTSIDRPLCAQSNASVHGFGVVMLAQASGGIARPVEQPMPTIVARGAHALIAPYYGCSEPRPTAEPLGTVTTKDRFGLVMPVTHHDTSNRVRPAADPLPTVTSAPRGELAVLVPAFGERPTQEPRCHSIEAPAPTICAQGRLNLAQASVAAGPRLDVLFRMLQPHELAAAMGFSTDEFKYEFSGNKTEITRQIGNAVAVRTAAALATALFGPQKAQQKPAETVVTKKARRTA